MLTDKLVLQWETFLTNAGFKQVELFRELLLQVTQRIVVTSLNEVHCQSKGVFIFKASHFKDIGINSFILELLTLYLNSM